MTEADDQAVPGTPVEELTSDQLDLICIHNLLEAATGELYFKDRDSRFIRANAGVARRFDAASAAELAGRTDFDFFTDEHAQTAYDDEQRIIATGEPLVDIEELETWPDRPDSWVSTTKLPLRDFEGRIIGTFGISRDITRRVLAEREVRRKSAELAESHAELQRVESELRMVLETSPDAISWYDHELRYRYANPAVELITGVAIGELIGRTNRELGHPAEFVALWEDALGRVLRTGRAGEVDYALVVDDDNRWYHSRLVAHRDDDGSVIGVLASTRDLTDLRLAERSVALAAVHDAVTGLANRALLIDRLSQSLHRLERTPGRIALLFVELDRFTQVNHALGLAGGDRVLVEVARRLESVSRRTDTVARFGGDEFMLLCDGLGPDEDVDGVAVRIAQALAVPMMVEGRELVLSATTGIVISQDPRADADELVRAAETAMSVARDRERRP